MADEKILVEIVLDDGSVQKGFARIQTESAKTSKEVTKDFQTVGDAFDQLSLSNISSQIRALPIAFLGVVGSVVAVGLAIREAFNLAVEGEKLNALDAQFNRLAASAGLSANTLRTGFENAGQGLADIEEILQSANSAIINLGSSAARLPEILELSRRVTVTLGGDIEERFAGIVRAIETGNSRALRQQGIIIDADKALQSYAATLGVATNELTTAQRQQAILNATLEQGNNQYKNISTSVQPLQDNLKILTTAIGDVIEGFAKFVNSTSGNFFTNLTREVVEGAKAISAFIDPTTTQRAEQLKLEVERLKFEIFETEGELEKFKNREIGTGAVLNGQLVQLQREFAAARRELDLFNGSQEASNRLAELSAQGGGGQVGGLTNEQIANEQARQAQLNQLLTQGAQSRIAILQAELSETILFDERKNLINQINDEQIRVNAQTLANDLLTINKQFSEAQGFSDEQREQARLAKVIDFNNKLLLAQKNTDKALISNAAFTSKQFQTVLGNGLATTFQAVGAAFAQGTSAAEAFKNAFLGIIGDIAIQLGNSYIAQGIAASANPLTPGAGGPLIAAGIGLSVLGGAIKALAGQSGARSNVPNGGGTGAELPTSPVFEGPGTELTPNEETQRLVDTQVVVNIQGDVLDSDESGSRIISLINDAFDKKGVQVRRGVTA